MFFLFLSAEIKTSESDGNVNWCCGLKRKHFFSDDILICLPLFLSFSPHGRDKWNFYLSVLNIIHSC